MANIINGNGNNNNRNNNNKNQRKPSNYFINNIERTGENFLDFKNSKDIYYDCPTIFRQLGQRKIELDKYGHFFFDIHFLEGCITACKQKEQFYGISYNATYQMVMSYTNNNMETPAEITSVMETHMNAWKAYSTISYYLQGMRNTGNFQYLYRLADILYTNHILRNNIL